MPTAVIMPKYEMAQETGTVGRWLVEEGATVAKGDPILEVETDKVTMEVESPAAGALAGISAAPGQVIPIGQTIAYILRPGETLPEGAHLQEVPPPGSPTPPATPVAARVAAAHNLDLAGVPGTGPAGRITRNDVEAHLAEHSPPSPGDLKRTLAFAGPRDIPAVAPAKIVAVPAARRLARELGVDLAAVAGSGPNGRIQSADVQRAAGHVADVTPSVPSAHPAIARTVPLTATRRTTAERMTASVRDIPQFTLAVDADMTRALAVLDDLRTASGHISVTPSNDDATPQVTLTAILVKACAYALRRHPGVNASFTGDHITEWADINIGTAVSIDQGLVVPVIRYADRHGLHELARQLADLGVRARSSRLRLADLQGGTFTLSNLGMYGIDHFTAIVNPPQAAILAVGRVAQRPVVTPDGIFVARPLATLTLTADHRVLDGAAAAEFLAAVQAALEHPGLLLA
jgi:pyruvate dehydrogenase E2 component (dihydrolipoamide acetyltransferase)